jgi:hypothetical protein
MTEFKSLDEYQQLAARTARMDIDPDPFINKLLTITTFALRISW